MKQLSASGVTEPPRTLATPLSAGTAAEEAKRRGLRNMKAVALGFLVGAAVIFLLTSWAQSAGWPAWVGYVRAAAEAGMVGALADWFAVTALFRYPMRLKIPHTAIIPTRKDQLGDSLGEFVGSNFLAEDVVRDKLRRVNLASSLGGWLAKPENADRVTAELATVLRGAITVLRDEDVQAVMEQAVARRVIDRQWGPSLGHILQQVVADGAHHKLVDLMCDRSYAWVRDNHTTVLRVVSDRAPTWSPKFVDELLADKVYGEVLSFAWAVKVDTAHPMRQALDRFLGEFAVDLQDDAETIARAEQVKQQVIEHPEVQKLIGAAWATAKEMLLTAAEDPSSELRQRMTHSLRRLGERLGSDDALRSKIDTWAEDAAAHIVTNYASELITLITDTVELWDAEQTSRKIELQVGRDLQFIRINGTVVGALAGLAIYTFAQLVF
ncbi:MAG: DUF445 family protein [Actinophytocola sp.]|nr:DUF445 family protein [Actinophytocola sp.]